MSRTLESIESTKELYEQIREGGNCSNLQSLIAKGADIQGISNYITPISDCVVYENINCLKALITAGADVNVISANPNGYSPLLYAIVQIYLNNSINDEIRMNLSLEIINILITAGADINYQSRNGFTALQLSIFLGYNQIVRLLIDRGADVNLLSGASINGKHSPLYTACVQGNFEIIKLLLENGADNSPVFMGFTALDRLKHSHRAVYDKLQELNIITASQAIFDTHGEHLDPESMENIFHFAKGGKSRRNKKRNKKSQRRKSSRRRRQRKN